LIRYERFLARLDLSMRMTPPERPVMSLESTPVAEGHEVHVGPFRAKSHLRLEVYRASMRHNVHREWALIILALPLECGRIEQKTLEAILTGNHDTVMVEFVSSQVEVFAHHA
jgi:hypothetical protein